MGYSCCVPGCKSKYMKDEPNVTVTLFKLTGIGEWRQKWLQNIPRKFDKFSQSTSVCIKHLDDKYMHSFNIHTNPDGTTHTVSNVLLIKLLYCTSMYYYEYKKKGFVEYKNRNIN